MAWRIAGAAPAVLSLAKFMAPLPFGRIDVTYRHGSRRARNLVAPQGRSVVLLSRPESRRGDKRKIPKARMRAPLVLRGKICHGHIGQQCCPNCGAEFPEGGTGRRRRAALRMTGRRRGCPAMTAPQGQRAAP